MCSMDFLPSVFAQALIADVTPAHTSSNTAAAFLTIHKYSEVSL